MTLQTTDFTAKHEFLVKCDYKAEFNETAAARARILCALDAACAAAESARDPEALQTAVEAQIAALDAIFRQYAKVAVLCCDLASVQTYMSFALKAQTQCRVTLETLERIKTSRAHSLAPKQGEGAATKGAPPDEKNAANELLRRWLERSERPANAEKSTNELLKAQLRSGGAATGFSPGAEIKPQNPSNEVLAGEDGPKP